MADKFGRNYKLSVQINSAGDMLDITLPLTLEFDIVRKTLSSNSHATFRIYNLSLAHRNAIRFNFSNYGTYRRVILKAGYGSNTPIVFQGNITQAWSVREGVNFITQIECLDGGFAFRNGYVSQQVPAKTPQKAVIQSMMQNLPYCTPGAIGPSVYTNTDTNTPAKTGNATGASYVGSTVTNLLDLTNGAFFVDREVAHCLGPNEYIQSGQVLNINSASGLLGTPVLEETLVHFDMIFEPQLQVGYAAQLTSITGENFNGLRKVTAVHHRGMISDAVCGEAITTAEFAYFNQLVGVTLT
jgi:hypothetical protein